MMSTVSWAFLVISCVVLGPAEEESNSTLRLVQMLFRHGARSPIFAYPDDPNPPEVWPEGLGKLTQLGRKQPFVLGKFLRTFYSGFITSNPNEVVAYSTASDRSQRSAQALLASLYAPSPPWTFDEEINWQPIPINYSPLSKDKILSFQSDCPRYFDEQARRLNTSEFQESLVKYQPVFDVVKLHVGFSDLMKVLLFCDTIAVEKANGLPVPSWVEPYFDEMTELSEFLLSYMFDSNVQLRVGPLLGKMVESMDAKIAGDILEQKVHIFSAHDANIIGLLQALRLYNNRRPPFCATLIFELHERPAREVRILYLNSTRPEDVTSHVAHVLQLEGCTEFCPLEHFRAIAKNIVPEDWDLECQSVDPGYEQTVFSHEGTVSQDK